MGDEFNDVLGGDKDLYRKIQILGEMRNILQIS